MISYAFQNLFYLMIQSEEVIAVFQERDGGAWFRGLAVEMERSGMNWRQM